MTDERVTGESSDAASSELRLRAEAAVQHRSDRRPRLRPRNTDKLLYELEVHGVELEMQNEELRAAQTKVEEARNRYHELYDLAPVPYVTLDRSSRIKDANLAAAKLLRVERHRLLGRPLSSFMREGAADRLFRHLGEVLESPIKAGCELELLLPGGEARQAVEIPVHIDSIGAPQDATRAAECRSAIIDLSELKDAEEGIRASEARIQALLDIVPDAIVSSDAAGRIESFNEAAARLFGYRRDEVLGQDVRMLMPSPYHDEHDEYVRRYLATGAPRIIGRPGREVSGLKRDGTVFPLELGIGEWSSRGERKFLAVIHDLSERKRAEEELAASEQRFRQIAERVDDAFVLVERDTRQISYVSPAFEAVWGRPAREAVGRPCGDLLGAWIHAEDRPRVRSAHDEYMHGHEPFDQEFRVVRPDEELRWVRGRIFPVEGEGGRIRRDVCVFQNRTHERELETQFRQVQKMEAVGQLASGVAHDFNNVLQAVLGCLNMALREDTSPEDAREHLRQAADAARRGGGLADRLMAFTRNKITATAPLELDPLVRKSAEMLGRFLTERIELEIHTDAGGQAVLAQEVEIEQILMNLAVNARDAMPHGGLLRIRTSVGPAESDDPSAAGALDGSARYVHIVVEDSGVGMDEATRGRIFEPFFTTKPHGTGLGLSTVFALTTQLGGSVHVWSEPGVGTRFTIRVPGLDAEPARAASAPTSAPVTLTGTVLLVEDEPLVRMALREDLKELGLKVLEAANGAQALALCEERAGRIDILVSDVTLPGMDGPTFADLLRQVHPDLRVLFISANPALLPEPSPDDARRIAGLKKPFTSAELVDRVRSLMGE